MHAVAMIAFFNAFVATAFEYSIHTATYTLCIHLQ